MGDYPTWYSQSFLNLHFGVHYSFWKVLSHCYLNYFFCFVPFSFSSGIANKSYVFGNCPIVLDYLRGDVGYFFHYYFFNVSFLSFCWPMFQLTDSVLGPSQSTDEPAGGTLYCHQFFRIFTLNNFFDSFHLSACMSHLFLHVFYCFSKALM